MVRIHVGEPDSFRLAPSFPKYPNRISPFQLILRTPPARTFLILVLLLRIGELSGKPQQSQSSIAMLRAFFRRHCLNSRTARALRAPPIQFCSHVVPPGPPALIVSHAMSLGSNLVSSANSNSPRRQTSSSVCARGETGSAQSIAPCRATNLRTNPSLLLRIWKEKLNRRCLPRAPARHRSFSSRTPLAPPHSIVLASSALLPTRTQLVLVLL